MIPQKEVPAPIVGLADVRKQREKKHYAELVMKKFDDAEHADKREFLERRADVERAARQRF